MANLATGEHQVSQRVSLHKNGRMELRKPGAHAAPAEPQGYVAGIGKTTDGGKTVSEWLQWPPRLCVTMAPVHTLLSHPPPPRCSPFPLRNTVDDRVQQDGRVLL